MQQVLQNLREIAGLATAKGLTETAQQITAFVAQMNAIPGNISPLMLDVLTRTVNGLRAKIEGADSKSTDQALKAYCQELAQTLLQSYTLTNEVMKEAKKLSEDNQRAKTNQKYVDEKKNEALRNFNQYLRQLRQNNELSLAQLLAFNEHVRKMLKKDFGVKNLPKQQQAQQQPEAGTDNPVNLQGMMSAFQGLTQAATSEDKDRMKNAASSFIGFLISMAIEALANVCKVIAPSISPFIGQMAHFAKGALSQMFNMGIEKASAAQTLTPPSANPEPTKPAKPKTPKTASTTPTAESNPGIGGTLMNAFSQFMGRNKGVTQTEPTAAKTKKPKQKSAHTLTQGLHAAFNHFVNTKKKPKVQTPVVPTKPVVTGGPILGPEPRKPRVSAK
ncbi:hypothetical protein [Candidatus Berkiella aquae]|uniref:Uncharacterized protein n=1 Tax=Candidatus Berkiella aquae TaxID=295108 RepID=A0A0Q9YWV5_9GAMM|nr:hypothetical protein [Candidatus Berkiella aquae]MCS5710974.1 hypothetical protein [Candidatus Berkiella aquae]